MKLRTLCMLLVLVLLAVFLVINWSALSQDMTVNLVYQEIQAPLATSAGGVHLPAAMMTRAMAFSFFLYLV